MYKALSDEIWVLGQTVMRENRIILPESLWEQTLKKMMTILLHL
jgi:hypothetical protein